MSLKSSSFAALGMTGCAVLHYLVAITMDVTILRQLGQFPPERLLS